VADTPPGVVAPILTPPPLVPPEAPPVRVPPPGPEPLGTVPAPDRLLEVLPDPGCPADADPPGDPGELPGADAPPRDLQGEHGTGPRSSDRVWDRHAQPTLLFSCADRVSIRLSSVSDA
jgi:hypothetical protein